VVVNTNISTRFIPSCSLMLSDSLNPHALPYFGNSDVLTETLTVPCVSFQESKEMAAVVVVTGEGGNKPNTSNTSRKQDDEEKKGIFLFFLFFLLPASCFMLPALPSYLFVDTQD
jgi:hypothetical protein